MNRERINKAFNDATQMRRDARWADGVVGVCMCPQCIEKREDSIAEKAVKVCYPRLPFVPSLYCKENVQYNYGKLRQLLERIRNIRVYNEENTEYFSDKKTHFCRRCGRQHTDNTTHKHKGKFYCTSCFDTMFECSDCGNLEDHNKKYQKRPVELQGSLEYVCRKCKEKMLFCGSCGCGEEKQLIKKVAERRDEVGAYSVTFLCRDCYDSGLETCNSCGKQTHASVVTHKRSKLFCPVCSEERSGIQNYDYKPLRPRFKKSKKEGKVTDHTLYMGWELEIAPDTSFISPEAITHMLKDHIGYSKIYAMTDGSISQAADTEGVELACHPFTWDYYKQEGYKDWDKMCLFLKKYEWTGSYRGLGIHIHTTKAAWGTHQIYKLLKFVYNNQEFMHHVAERGQTTYCKYDRLNPEEQKVIAKEKMNEGGDSHYNAINLNNGESGQASKTIEFRIFQSTLEPFNFHKNIEFVHACYEFTRDSATMTVPAFREWLGKHRRAYPCLVNYLNLRRV
jgi:hypothetical protein